MKTNLSGARGGKPRKSASDRQIRFVFEREPAIPDFARLRAAQMSRCGLGVVSHMRALREKGVPEAKILQVENWWNSSLFSERERLALTLAELISVSCETMTETVLKVAQDHFTKEEIAYLVVVILAVNDFADPVLPAEHG